MTGHPLKEDGFKTIDSAPKDGSHIQVVIPGHGSDNIISWYSGFVNDAEQDCCGWVFMTEQESPSCWTDGVCWESNENCEKSVEPTHWQPLSPLQKIDTEIAFENETIESFKKTFVATIVVYQDELETEESRYTKELQAIDLKQAEYIVNQQTATCHPFLHEKVILVQEKAIEDKIMKTNLTQNELGNALVFSARYTHNRSTGGALQITNTILKVWEELDQQTRLQIAREAKFEAKCNKEEWSKVINRFEEQYHTIEH